MRFSSGLTRVGGPRFLFFGLSVLVAAVLLSISAVPAWSQATSTSTVTGQVTDQQNAAIVGAEVRLVDTADQFGAYHVEQRDRPVRFRQRAVRNLQHHRQQERVSHSHKVNAQQVVVGSTLTINAMLEVGATTTTVEVSASKGADLQTTNASVGTTITSARPPGICRTWAATSPRWPCCSPE